ncbi:TPA: capsular biosynthesis protein [Aeromonas sobria]|nr:capsular biosynthesis protein [Aeromonas sobria]
MSIPIQYLELESLYAATLARGIRSLAITSAEGGEGVSSICDALARRSEADGLRTLLVDLNLYHPGRATALAWGPNDVPEPVAHGRSLSLLPAPGKDLMAFRNKDTLCQLLQRWFEHYDVVIFDTSPLNALNRGNIPADQVCGACDGALLVVLAGVTPTSAVQSAVDKLTRADANLVGAVYNDKLNPGLASEILRELNRLPSNRVTEWLKRWCRRSSLLNFRI